MAIEATAPRPSGLHRTCSGKVAADGVGRTIGVGPLVGPNGAGRTTSSATIDGLAPPERLTGGELLAYRGQRVPEGPPTGRPPDREEGTAR